MKALVYANGSSSIGLGHIMRTLAICKELYNRQVIIDYVVDKSDENAINLIKSNGFDVIIVDNLIKYISSCNIIKYDIALIDSYDISEHAIESFYEISKRVIYIDDLAVFNNYDMDILINTSIEALRLNYKGRAKKLLGPQYAILREEFRNVEFKTPRQNVEKVLITFGGADTNNVTKLVLDQLLDTYKDIEYNVVLGSSYRYKDFMINNYNIQKVKFHINVSNMKDIMTPSDLAISAGGNTLYELCACGIPTIAVIIAENQKQFVRGIHKKTGIDYIDLSETDISKDNCRVFKSTIDKYIKNYELRKEISQRMFEVVDVNGCSRIADEILKLF